MQRIRRLGTGTGWGLLVLLGAGLLLAACGGDADATPTASRPATVAVGNLDSPPPVPIAQDDSRFPVDVPQGADFEQAQSLYNQHCAACHGRQGQGQMPDPFAPGMAPPHDDTGHTWHHPDQANFATTWNGTLHLGGGMPAFHNRMTPDEILLVLGYIKQWWGEDYRAAQRERTLMFKEMAGQ